MFAPFQKAFKTFSEIEIRKGMTGGEYCVVSIKLGTMPKNELSGVLSLMHEITERTPRIPARTEMSIPVGSRKVPVETTYVSG